jgi:hypothetical protein
MQQPFRVIAWQYRGRLVGNVCVLPMCVKVLLWWVCGRGGGQVAIDEEERLGWVR